MPCAFCLRNMGVGIYTNTLAYIGICYNVGTHNIIYIRIIVLWFMSGVEDIIEH